jgi:hypothetical protein
MTCPGGTRWTGGTKGSWALHPAADDERVDLVFEGVDTVGTVAWGGTVLGTTANMHRSYRIDMRALADGEPRPVTVDLRTATAYADELRNRLGPRPSAYADSPFNFVRKLACSFGWDWGLDLRTAGLWKPVRVEWWRTTRLAGIRPLVGPDAAGTGRVELHVGVERKGLGGERPLRVRAATYGREVEAVVPVGESGTVLVIEVPNAPVWWPVGYGTSRSSMSAHAAPVPRAVERRQREPVGYEDWGWKGRLHGATWGPWYAAELFRDICTELDPTRPYGDNSPYTPGQALDAVHPTTPTTARPTSGTCGTGWTTAPTARRCLSSAPSSAPGAAGMADAGGMGARSGRRPARRCHPK